MSPGSDLDNGTFHCRGDSFSYVIIVCNSQFFNNSFSKSRFPPSCAGFSFFNVCLLIMDLQA